MARGRAHRVPGHGGQKGRTLQDGHAAAVPSRTRGWWPCEVAQQGDLAESVALIKRVDEASVPDHLRATGLDHVEPVAAITLLEDHLPGRELGMLEPGAELFDRRRGQRAEQGDRPKDLDVGVADAHLAVEPAQRRAAGGHGGRRQQADREERGAGAEHKIEGLAGCR
jgi:hypothetical protein